MKKLFALLLAVLLLAGCSASKKNGTPEEICVAMEQKNVLPVMLSLDAEEFYDLTGIEESLYKAGAYRVASDGLLADEIVILDCVDSAAAAEAERLLRQRLQDKADQARNYSPEQYQIIQACSVEKRGNTVALIVNRDASVLSKILSEYR